MVGPVHINDGINKVTSSVAYGVPTGLLHRLYPWDTTPDAGRLAWDPHFNDENNESQRGQMPFSGS